MRVIGTAAQFVVHQLMNGARFIGARVPGVSGRRVRASAAMSYKYVVVGGGNSSGYAAKEFVSRNVAPGELCIITAEPYVAYERPALSKAYLFPEGAARLPGFHTCVGGGGDRQTPEWYVEKGIEYKLNTKVTEIDVTKKTITTESGDSIAYENLIFATGCRPMTMADFKTPGAELPGLYYLRDVVDADRLIEGIKAAKEKGGKAVVVGGGYIGMEVAAALQMHGLKVTMVFPEAWFMLRLFTEDLASFYEDYYQKKGISIMKGVLASGFEAGADGQVGKVLLNNGQSLDVDGLVVVGTGARPNSELVGKQVDLEAGAVKVDTKLRASVPNLWAIGDVAAFPLVKYGGRLQRQEHVTNCRQTAAHAVRDIMDPENTTDYNYLPFFYSRVFDLSWVFYGVNEGDIVTFGDKAEKKFGSYWVKDGKVMGAFLEGGKPEEVASLKKVAEQQPAAPADLASQGLAFAASL